MAPVVVVEPVDSLKDIRQIGGNVVEKVFELGQATSAFATAAPDRILSDGTSARQEPNREHL